MGNKELRAIYILVNLQTIIRVIVECVECVDEYLHLKAHAINASDAASSSWAILPVFHVTKIVVPQSAPPHSGTKVPVAVKARRSDSQTHTVAFC